MDIPEDVARKKHAKRVEQTAGQAYRRGAAIGALVAFGGVLGRIAFWRTLMNPGMSESAYPSSGNDVICANCGHEMSLSQGGQAPHDWHIGH